MSLDTKPNLDKSKFEQLEGDILNLSGCTNIYGCLDVKKSGVINSNNGYDISGITQIRLGEDITAIAIGSDAYSKCCNSIAIGYCSSATTRCAISIGALSQVISSNSIAIGNSSIVCGQQSVAIGSYSKTYKLSSVAVGDSSRSNTLHGVSIGANAGSCYDNYFQTVVGGYAGRNSITCDITALGYLAELSSSGSTHIGIGSFAGVTSCGCSTIMIGTSAGYNSCGDLNIFIGHGVGCENTDSGKFILGNCYYELGCYVLICGDFFTGNVTIPKLSGLTSSAVGVDCNGTLMRISQPSGGTISGDVNISGVTKLGDVTPDINQQNFVVIDNNTKKIANSGLKYHVYGSEFHYAQDLTTTTTTLVFPDFDDKLTLVTSILPIGTYRIMVSYGMNKKTNTSDLISRVLVDGNVLGDIHNFELSDSTTWSYSTRMMFITFSTETTHTINLQFSQENKGTLYIRDASLELIRVL